MEYSIVVTTYNDGREITAYLDGILKQTKLPCEMIIVDGGSTDDTIERIKEYQKGSGVQIRLFYGKRLNIAEGYNEAIRNTKCKYIGITGVGNFYDVNYFSDLLHSMQVNNSDVEHGMICVYGENKFATSYGKAFLGKVTNPSNRGCLIKKEVFENVGYFLTDFIYAGEDEEFYQRVIGKGYQCHWSSDNKIYWKVPSTFQELNKQISNYMIGSMQIQSTMKYLWSIKFSILFTIMLFCSLIWYKLIFFPVMIFTIFIWRYKEIRAAFLKYYYHVMKSIFLVKNIKFLQKKYKVRRNDFRG